MRIVCILLIALCPMMSVAAKEISNGGSHGKKLYTEHKCQICHGPTGCNPVRDGYPVIAGQNGTYLARQIFDIAEGVRDNSQSKLMRPMVKSISRKDVNAIAEYLSTQRCG